MDVDTTVYIKNLAGIFKTILRDYKKLSPFLDDFVEKSHKLELHLKSTIVIFSSFIDSFKKISEKSSNIKKGSSNDIKDWILKTSEHHCSIKHILLSITKVMSNGLFNLKLKLDERRKNMKMLEKVHGREYKSVKNEIKRKQESLAKFTRNSLREHHCNGNSLDIISKDLNSKHKLFENQEKQAVRRICLEERGLFCDVAGFMKQLLLKEAEMFKEMIIVDESVEGIQQCIENPNDIPDSVMNEILDGSHSDIIKFDTPATSVNGSLRGSRCNSFSSLISSRPSSPLCIIEQNDNILVGLNKFGNTRRKSQFASYESNKISEDVTLSYANPFYTQHLISPDRSNSNLFVSSSIQIQNNSQNGRGRGQSCSPTRQQPSFDSRSAFSTIRRTRSPYRKQTNNNFQESEYKGTSGRPPLPRKFKSAPSASDQYLQPTSSLATYKGPDLGLSIWNTGTLKTMANIRGQDLNDRHLWTETILPKGRRIPISRSLSLTEQRKSHYTSGMSDSLIKTLGSLQVSPDDLIQGR